MFFRFNEAYREDLILVWACQDTSPFSLANVQHQARSPIKESRAPVLDKSSICPMALDPTLLRCPRGRRNLTGALQTIFRH